MACTSCKMQPYWVFSLFSGCMITARWCNQVHSHSLFAPSLRSRTASISCKLLLIHLVFSVALNHVRRSTTCAHTLLHWLSVFLQGIYFIHWHARARCMLHLMQCTGATLRAGNLRPCGSRWVHLVIRYTRTCHQAGRSLHFSGCFYPMFSHCSATSAIFRTFCKQSHQSCSRL